MTKFIEIRDKSGDRNVSLSVDKNGEVHLLGVLNHNTKLGISVEDAQSLIQLLKTIVEREVK